MEAGLDGAPRAASPGPASLGDRLLGQIVDALVAVGLMLAAALVLRPLGLRALGLGYLLALAYLLFCDALEGGRSLGKRLTGSAVVDATTGRPCTSGQSVLRNFLLMLLGPIDWIFIFGSKRQRLGDKAANTIVVRCEAPR